MRKGIAYSIGISIVATSFTLSQACTKSTDSDDDLVGNWTRSSDFDGNARSEAVTFIIGDYIYLTTGTTDRDRFRDLWEYNLTRRYWTQKADLPAAAAARNSAVALVIGDKVYVGTGYDGANKLKDFWRYDPVQNQWAPIAAFDGTARYDAIAFSVNGKGYVGSGFDGNYLKDLWEYDPVADDWHQKASIGDFKRTASVAFVVNNKAYVCSGNNNGSALNDLWVYDDANDTWTEKRKITNSSDETYDDEYSGIARFNTVALVIDNKVYLSTGESGSLNPDTWEYNPETDLWTKKTAFEGTARTGCVSFSAGGRGFILTGRSGAQSFDNAYEWHPGDDQVDND
jgi:N-acetylneuraminic acid mutarotase